MSDGVGFSAAATTGHGLGVTWLISEAAGVLSIQIQNIQSMVAADCLYLANLYGLNSLTTRSAGSVCYGDEKNNLLGGGIIAGYGGTRIVNRLGTLMQVGGYNGSAYTDQLIQFPQIPGSAGSGGLYVCVDNTGTFYKKSSCP